MTEYEVITEFSDFLRGYGIETTAPLIANGKINRAYVVGDKRGSKNLSYLIHTDGKPAGFFEYFKIGERVNWKSSAKFEAPTHQQRAEFERVKRQNKIDTAAKYESAAIVARKLWQQGAKVTNPNQHPYLGKKRITGNYARVLGGDLLIAVWNEQRELSTLQFIDASGAKRFLTGGKKAGCFAVIGKHHAPHDRILVVEGYATGESLHTDTGHFVICAMDSGNLEPVARVIRRLFEHAPITICGDNDANGVGQKAAKAASLACNGGYMIPPDVGTDWNDVLTSESEGGNL